MGWSGRGIKRRDAPYGGPVRTHDMFYHVTSGSVAVRVASEPAVNNTPVGNATELVGRFQISDPEDVHLQKQA